MKKVAERSESSNQNNFSIFSIFLVIFIVHFSYIVSNIWQTEFTVLENIFLLGSKLTEVLSTPIYHTIDPNKMPEVRKKSAAALDRLMYWERQPIGAKITYNFNKYSSAPFKLVDKLEDVEISLKYDDIYLYRNLTSPSHTASIMHTEKYKDKYLTPPHPLDYQTNNKYLNNKKDLYKIPTSEHVFPYINITFYLSENALSNLHAVKYMYDKLTNKDILTKQKKDIGDIVTEFKSKKLIRMEYETLNKQKNMQNMNQKSHSNIYPFSSSLSVAHTLSANFDGEYIYDESKVDKSLKSVFLYIHGGGLAVLDHRAYDKVLRRHANLLTKETVLIALDYRLAPEYRYPVALEDCIYTLNWIYENGKHVGLDASRIIIAGDSGGGNLVASTISVGLSKPTKYAWIKSIKAVGLIYPSVCRGCATFSNIMQGDLFHINLKAAQWFDMQYDQSVGSKPNWHQSPFYAPVNILANFPPTYFVLFSHDIAFDAGILYHEKLRRLGVSTGLFTAPGVHGFYGCDLWSKHGVESVEWMTARLNEHI